MGIKEQMEEWMHLVGQSREDVGVDGFSRVPGAESPTIGKVAPSNVDDLARLAVRVANLESELSAIQIRMAANHAIVGAVVPNTSDSISQVPVAACVQPVPFSKNRSQALSAAVLALDSMEAAAKRVAAS